MSLHRNGGSEGDEVLGSGWSTQKTSIASAILFHMCRKYGKMLRFDKTGINYLSLFFIFLHIFMYVRNVSY